MPPRSLLAFHLSPSSAACWVCGAQISLMCFSRNCRRNMDKRTRWCLALTVLSSSTSMLMLKKSFWRRGKSLQGDRELWVYSPVCLHYLLPDISYSTCTALPAGIHVPVLCVMKVTTDVLTRDGKDIAFGDYSATWRFHRKIVHGALWMFGEGSSSIEKISEYSSLTT